MPGGKRSGRTFGLYQALSNSMSYMRSAAMLCTADSTKHRTMLCTCYMDYIDEYLCAPDATEAARLARTRVLLLSRMLSKAT